VVVPFWNTGGNVRAEESLEGNKKRTRELRKNFKMILYSDIHSWAVREGSVYAACGCTH